MDPLAELMPEWSSYAYTFNNPVNFTDPTGMVPEGGGCDDPPCDPNYFDPNEVQELDEVIVTAPSKNDEEWSTELSHRGGYSGSRDNWIKETGMQPSEYTTEMAVEFNQWYLDSAKEERLRSFNKKLKFFFYDMGTLDALQYGIGAGGVSALARSSRTFNPNFGLVGSKSSSSISPASASVSLVPVLQIIKTLTKVYQSWEIQSQLSEWVFYPLKRSNIFSKEVFVLALEKINIFTRPWDAENSILNFVIF